MKDYPNLMADREEDRIELLRYIVKERRNDVSDYYNLQNQYILGRKVAKIPTGAADVALTDRVGDFNVTSTYAYYLIDNAGTAEWRRVAISSW